MIMLQKTKIQNFTDLNALQECHRVVVSVYQMTKSFPQSESFGLISQMRRAAVSITSNIAEGFGRKGYKEKEHFYYLAQGSLTELKNQLLVARDVGHISCLEYEHIHEQTIVAHRLLQGLLTKTKEFINHKS
jgi:four helix bundle protein